MRTLLTLSQLLNPSDWLFTQLSMLNITIQLDKDVEYTTQLDKPTTM